MKCPHCGGELPKNAAKCPTCGMGIVRGKYCPHCHGVVPMDAQVCPRCKKSIAAAAQAKPLTKRWWFWTVAAVLVLGIIGNMGNALRPDRAMPTASALSSEAPETNPFLLPEVEVNDVQNGARTEKLGEWASIHMEKADARAASEEEFTEFAQTRVSGKNYKWFSVIFEDHTGIQFTGGYTYVSTYGQLDEEGCISQAMGDISLDSGAAHTSYALREEKPAPTEEPTPAPTEPTDPTEAPAPPPAQETVPASAPEETPAPEIPQPTQKPDNNNGGANTPFNPTGPEVEKTNPPAPPVQQPTQSGTVYWTPNGEKYHSTPNCATLKNSSTINSGTIDQAINTGHSEPCKVCH